MTDTQLIAILAVIILTNQGEISEMNIKDAIGLAKEYLKATQEGT